MPAITATPERHKRNVQQTAWNKDNTTRIPFRLNNHTDADIIAYLKKQPNTQGYIKSLIRADMAKNK